MAEREQFVIVGASLAGLRAAEALRENGYGGDISIVGAENRPPYNRPPLSKQILTGRQDFEELEFPVAEDLDVTWHLGAPATGLDITNRKVMMGSGATLAYDRLLIATGVAPIVPPIPNVDLPGVHVLRTIEDAERLRADMEKGGRLAVVGAGFIGCEVAASARQLGLEVTVIDQADRPMARVLQPDLARVFQSVHEEEGVSFRLGRTVTSLLGDSRVTGLTLDDGETIEADIVLIGIGSRPVVQWLEGSGLVLRNGVVCDASCRALNGGGRIAAAGDVAVWPHMGYGGQDMRIEHWTNAAQQGAAAALALLEEAEIPYVPLPSFWSDQYACKLQSLGTPAAATRFEIVAGSLEERKFLAECWQDDALVGAIALNMAPRLARYRMRLEAELAEKGRAVESL